MAVKRNGHEVRGGQHCRGLKPGSPGFPNDRALLPPQPLATPASGRAPEVAHVSGVGFAGDSAGGCRHLPPLFADAVSLGFRRGSSFRLLPFCVSVCTLGGRLRRWRLW